MDAPDGLPDGLTSRAASPEDVDAVTAIIAACELDLDGVVEVDRDDVRMSFERLGFDPSTDMVLVLDGDRPVGWAEVVPRHRAEADVLPSHRGRGIGSALLAWTEARARELGEARAEQMVTDANAYARALFIANGYTEAEHAWILQIRFEDGPPPDVEVPEGITIRPWRPGQDDEAVYEVVETAFREWPGRAPQTYEEWRSGFFSHAAFAPERSPLAFEGEELVGATLYLDYPDSDEGWVQQLATKATHRHRGIARALLNEAFRIAQASGKPACGLSTSSYTGALSLYEKVGMHVRRSYTGFIKSL